MRASRSGNATRRSTIATRPTMPAPPSHSTRCRTTGQRETRMRSPLFTGVLVLAAAGLGATANAQEVVKVAFIEVLSGPFAQAGEGSLKQLREVVTQLNAKSAPTD